MSPAFQRKSYWCGVAAIQTALRVMQVKKPQQAIANLCAVNRDEGTSEEEIKRALLALGMGVDEVETSSEKLAHSWLVEHLDCYGPAIICVDRWEHWVTVIGRCGDMFVVFDPSNAPDNKQELGVHFYSWIGLRTRWLLPKQDGGKRWYGVGVSE